MWMYDFTCERLINLNFDEPLLDADGNIIGIQTVANEER